MAKVVGTPKRLVRRNHGTGHSYRLDGDKVPGVTTVLRVKSIDALPAWAAREAAESVLDNWDRLQELKPSERYNLISKAHVAARNKKATAGTRIHSFGEKLIRGEEVNIPDEFVGPVRAYAKFLDRWQIEAIATEVPIASTRYRYGGTGDLIGHSPKLCDGQPFWLDIKSGKGFYKETALQLGAYRAGDLLLVDGQETDISGLLRAHGFDVDETSPLAFGAHVMADDTELIPVDAGESSFRAFLYLLGVYRWEQASYDDPPVGRAIWPETDF